jgi:hypothetical protein
LPMRLFIFVSALIFLGSCSGNQGIPEGVLEKEKMIDLLVSLHYAEAEVMTGKSLGDSTFSDSVNFQAVFEKSGVLRAEYDSSMKFYSSRPELLNEIYDEVILRLSAKQAETEGKTKGN